jgi:hypothetical protein
VALGRYSVRDREGAFGLTDVDSIEKSFHRAMADLYETAKREIGYNATRFMQMVAEIGGLATAKRLLQSDQVSDGFTTLWEHQRLDLSVEAHVLQAEFASLFDEDDLETARTRLADYGYRPQARPDEQDSRSDL